MPHLGIQAWDLILGSWDGAASHPHAPRPWAFWHSRVLAEAQQPGCLTGLDGLGGLGLGGCFPSLWGLPLCQVFRSG